MTSEAFRGMSRATMLGIALVAALASSCGTVSMEVPKRFLVTEERRGELKAISAEETKLWVREFDDDDQGDLLFWSDALRRDLTANRGYTLLEETTVQDREGNGGTSFLLETTVQGRAHRELLALFVYEGARRNRIRVVELVGEKEPFEAALAELKAALRTLAP